MVEVEKRLGQPLEQVIPHLYNEHGLVGAAQRLGVPVSTLSYWIMKLGFVKETKLRRQR